VTPGLARLRADRRAETIRQLTLADQQRAAAEARAAIKAAAAKAADAAAMPPALAASRESPITPKPPASPRVATGLSDGATQLVCALFKVAGDGGWIDQRQIPHGLAGRTFPGFLSALTKRGLVEARWDGGRRFSARITPAGVSALGGRSGATSARVARKVR
jgi:hypothetical protein